MKIVQVIDSIRKQASGPSYSVVTLCRVLAERGHDVSLHVLAPAPDMAHAPFQLHAHPPSAFPPKFGASASARNAIEQDVARADVVHTNGLWRLPQVYASRASARHSCQYVASPRGALSTWAQSWHKWRKKVFWGTLQGRALRRADCLHATGPSELADCRRKGLLMPVASIPNGVDIPVLRDVTREPSAARKLLFLARVHPIKNVPTLLQAWRQVQDGAPDWELHVVGPDEGGHTRELKAQTQALGAERVHFRGAVLGEEKRRVFEDADLYVLPSHSENFGVSVAEALSYAVPSIVTTGAPWGGLETHGCGWWVDPQVEPLSHCLRNALGLSDAELQEMGRKGRAWMERDFSWDRVGRQMSATYEWLVGGGPAPQWVDQREESPT